MSTVKLKGSDGTYTTYTDVDSLSLPDGSGGSSLFGSVELQEKTASPSTSQQVIQPDSGKDALSKVTIAAISPIKTASDLTASGDTVTVPAGWYASQASKSVASGSAGTPSATKGTPSGGSVSVTPSVTNTSGYIAGGTKTGTAVIVSASELVSGTETISDTEQHDVTLKHYAQVSDSYLAAENIKSGVTILGVEGSYAGITPSGNVDIVDTSETNVASYATARISAAERAKLIGGNIKSGVTLLGVAGSYTGVDTSDATAAASDILSSKTAYVNGSKLTGSLQVLGQFNNGQIVEDLYFNTTLPESNMNTWLASLSYDRVDTGTGLHYAYLGLGYLCAGDLSSVNLGNGYVVYWGYDLTLLYSSLTFDASQFIPGFKVTKTGWQAQHLSLTSSREGGVGVIVNRSSFNDDLWVTRSGMMSTNRYAFGRQVWEMSASGAAAAGVPNCLGFADIWTSWHIPDSGPLYLTRSCILLMNIAALQQSQETIGLQHMGSDDATNMLYFSVYDPASGTTGSAALHYDDGTLTLVSATLGGNDISAYIPYLSWTLNMTIL